MRSSSYNIIVKVDNQVGKYTLLNGYTRAFDIVNQNVYLFLKTNGESGNISEETKEKLVKRGYITSLSKDDEIKLVKQLLDKVYDDIRLKSFGFHFIISYDCNLRCVYCYEDPILNGNTCLPKSQISKEQVDKAYEIIIEKDKNLRGKFKNIALYGGEPFLPDNYEMVKYIVEKGKALGYRFSATSNGYAIDKYLDFLEENKEFSLQITIDGVEDIHNIRKPHYQNKDSFTKITNNVDRLLKLGISVSIRVNTDPYSMTRIEELLDYFKERGWFQYKNFKSYCALLRKDISYKVENKKWTKKVFKQSDFYQNYINKKLNEQSEGKMECQDFGIRNTLIRLLQGKKNPYKGNFCGAQSSNIIFDPLGDVYSCWDIVGNREYRVGCYIPEFNLEENFADRWFNLRISQSACAKCKYVFFCGGGCPASIFRKKGEIHPGNCNDYPKLFDSELKVIYRDIILKKKNSKQQ